MGRATFWAIFSQMHLITLSVSYHIQKPPILFDDPGDLRIWKRIYLIGTSREAGF
jgi:hypothetical protein